MGRGGPPGGGHRGGPPMGGRPPMGMGGMRPMGMRPVGGRRPPMGGGNPMVTFAIIGVMIIAGAITALGDNILWIAIIIGVVAIVGMILYYKYRKDRAEAKETAEMMNMDLNKFGSQNSEAENLANKYENK